MSTETITTIISGLALLVSFFAAFGWLIHRTDARTDRLDQRLTARIDSVAAELSGRIGNVERELVEVKIAVARIEGPPRHLLSPR